VGEPPAWETFLDKNLFPKALEINIVALRVMTPCTISCVLNLTTLPFSETIASNDAIIHYMLIGKSKMGHVII
jgi:hypothetical protein